MDPKSRGGRIFDFEKEDKIGTGLLELFPYEGPRQKICYETAEFSAVCPYSGLPGHLMRSRAAAALAGPVAGGEDLALARHKTVAYLPHLRTLRAARAAGYDEGLRCDHRGRLLGGSRSNLFLVRNGRLLTPGRDGGYLPGITRAIVLGEVAPDLEVPVEETELERADLERADEAFLTNSLWGVLPLARLGACTLPSAAPHSITRALASGYLSALERECGSQ